MPCIDIVTNTTRINQPFAIFDRLIPNFSVNLSDIDFNNLEKIESWYKKISADDIFIQEMNDFVNSDNNFAIALVNSSYVKNKTNTTPKSERIHRVIIYFITKSNSPQLKLNFFNLIELSHLIFTSFSTSLWEVLETAMNKRL